MFTLSEVLQTSCPVPRLQCSSEVAYAGPATGITASVPPSPTRLRRVEGLPESDDEPVFVGDTEIINQDYRGSSLILVPFRPKSGSHQWCTTTRALGRECSRKVFETPKIRH